MAWLYSVNQPRPVLTEAPQNWQGKLCLVFANRRGATQLVHNEGQAPLKVQRPFYPEGDEVCHSVIMHTAGGIVGGDRLTFDIRLHPNSKALITTPAASKIYRTNGSEAYQSLQVEVAEGACLEWLPQETIVFNQALFRQTLRVNLAPTAQWIGWDIVRFGRSARGERFIEGTMRSHTEVWRGDRPIWIDRQWLEGSETSWASPHALGGCSVVGSLAWIDQAVDSDWVDKVRSLWIGETHTTGVTRLQSGLLCRYRGNSTTEARQWFIQVWHLIRSRGLGRSTCVPRVWGV